MAVMVLPWWRRAAIRLGSAPRRQAGIPEPRPREHYRARDLLNGAYSLIRARDLLNGAYSLILRAKQILRNYLDRRRV